MGSPYRIPQNPFSTFFFSECSMKLLYIRHHHLSQIEHSKLIIIHQNDKYVMLLFKENCCSARTLYKGAFSQSRKGKMATPSSFGVRSPGPASVLGPLVGTSLAKLREGPASRAGPGSSHFLLALQKLGMKGFSGLEIYLFLVKGIL